MKIFNIGSNGKDAEKFFKILEKRNVKEKYKNLVY